jgi:multidrug efflux pump subunit AcrA (membrane-fusion protein)
MKAGPLALALAVALSNSPSRAETVNEAPLSVSVLAAKVLCFSETVRATGTISAGQVADVVPPREGLKISELLAEQLDEVKANQVLAHLVALDGSFGSQDVRSPLPGVVILAPTTIGVPVSARQGPLFRILVRGEIELHAELLPADLPKVKEGQTATVHPVAGPPIPAKVSAVFPSFDPATQSGGVTLKLTPGGAAVRVGTFARAEITTAQRCGVAAPYSAVSYETDGTIIYVTINNRVEARLVSLGIISGNDVEVSSGLNEGDLVVLRSAAFVRDGEIVKAIRKD